MAADEKGLKGLKAYAESSLFSDMKVTPGMKERLRQRIRGAAARPDPMRSSVRRPWAIRSVAAVAAVGVLVMIGQQVAKQPREQQLTSSTMAGREERLAAMAPAAAGAEGLQVGERQDQAGNAVTLTMKDSIGASTGRTDYDNSTAAMTAATGGTANLQPAEAEPGRKIVRNADYTFEVKDARSALEQLQNLATAIGGYAVEANLIRGQDGSANGHLVLRVPAGSYTAAVQQVRQIGEVRQEKQWSQDVTERYMDLSARINILQQHEQKLTELAQKAATFDDWLKLTKEINETRAQIEQMQGQFKLLSNQVEYSTITIALLQPAIGFTPVPEGPGMWGAMIRAFNRSVATLARVGSSLLIGAAASVPFLLPTAVVGAAAALVVRRRRQRREP